MNKFFSTLVILCCISCIYLRKSYYTHEEIFKFIEKREIPIEDSFLMTKESLKNTFPDGNISFDMIGLKLFDKYKNQLEVSSENCSIEKIQNTNSFEDLNILTTNELDLYYSLYPGLKERVEKNDSYTLLVLWSVKAGRVVTNDFINLANETNRENNAQILYINTDVDEEYFANWD